MTNRVFKPLAVAAALLAPVASVTLVTARGAGAQGASPGGIPAVLEEIRKLRADLAPRKYYLTKGTFDGTAALTACANGFHMASMWEIHDTSNLRYESQLGFLDDDSGSGPPANREGWVRTGTSADDSGAAGVNCNVWTTTGGEGTVAMLDWRETTTYPWASRDDGCNQGNRVWCVQN
jgi:hypothetical protein